MGKTIEWQSYAAELDDAIQDAILDLESVDWHRLSTSSSPAQQPDGLGSLRSLVPSKGRSGVHHSQWISTSVLSTMVGIACNRYVYLFRTSDPSRILSQMLVPTTFLSAVSRLSRDSIRSLRDVSQSPYGAAPELVSPSSSLEYVHYIPPKLCLFSTDMDDAGNIKALSLVMVSSLGKVAVYFKAFTNKLQNGSELDSGIQNPASVQVHSASKDKHSIIICGSNGLEACVLVDCVGNRVSMSLMKPVSPTTRATDRMAADEDESESASIPASETAPVSKIKRFFGGQLFGSSLSTASQQRRTQAEVLTTSSTKDATASQLEDQGGSSQISSPLVGVMALNTQALVSVHAAGGFEMWKADSKGGLLRSPMTLNIAHMAWMWMSSMSSSSSYSSFTPILYEVLATCAGSSSAVGDSSRRTRTRSSSHIDSVQKYMYFLIAFSRSKTANADLYLGQFLVSSEGDEPVKLLNMIEVASAQPSWRSRSAVNKTIGLTISGKIAYIFLPDESRLLWVSVAHNVNSESQVRGQVSNFHTTRYGSHSSSQLLLLASCDSDPRLSEENGGQVVLLFEGSLCLFASGVCAPYDMDVEPPSNLSVEKIFRRAWIQTASGQSNASRTTLQRLFDLPSFGGSLGQVIDRVSLAITDGVDPLTVLSSDDPLEASNSRSQDVAIPMIDSIAVPSNQPAAMLVNERLAKRIEEQLELILILSTSLQDHQRNHVLLWDLASVSVKRNIVERFQKLKAMKLLRETENKFTKRREEFGGHEGQAGAVANMFLDTTTAEIFSQTTATTELREEFWWSLVISEGLDRSAEALSIPSLYEKLGDIEIFVEVLSEVVREKAWAPATKINARKRRDLFVGCSAANEAVYSIVLGALSSTNDFPAGFNVASLLSSTWLLSTNLIQRLFKFLLDVTDVMAADISSIPELDLAGARSTTTSLCDSILKLLDFESVEDNAVLKKECLRSLLKLNAANQALELALSHKEFEVLLELAASVELRSSPNDYEGMKEWKRGSEARNKFEDIMIRALDRFGEDFALFAFEWLETNQFAHLLLDRSNARQLALLAVYFNHGKGKTSKLRWIFDLRNGNYVRALIGSYEQAKVVSIPGNPNSFSKAKSLLSIAKLCMIMQIKLEKQQSGDTQMDTDGSRGHRGPFSQNKDLQSISDDVERRLYLIRAQENLHLVNADDSIMSISSMVSQYVKGSLIVTEQLVMRCVVALEIILRGTEYLDQRESQQLNDFVWRGLVERELHVWDKIVSKKGRGEFGDDVLIHSLKSTAFFAAASEVSLTISEFERMVQRRVFAGIVDGTREDRWTSSLGPEAILIQLLYSCVDLIH